MNTRLISRQELRERLPRIRLLGQSARSAIGESLRMRWRDQRRSSAGLPDPVFEILVGMVSVLVPALV
ncbi:MAG TPA: hypothetical protein VFI12_09980, partial [Thermomicrobiales bacterium]|nr:hypothetical protein [Thermomicrobiales bacterium]